MAPRREKTQSEILLERFGRLEDRVGKLTSRIKVLETDVKKVHEEMGAVRDSYFKELAHALHGTEPPPAIKAPEPSSEPPTLPRPERSKP